MPKLITTDPYAYRRIQSESFTTGLRSEGSTPLTPEGGAMQELCAMESWEEREYRLRATGAYPGYLEPHCPGDPGSATIEPCKILKR